MLRPVSIYLTAAVLAVSAAQARPLRPAEFGQVCAVDIERFCPTLSGTTETRNQLICLRPYRSSLARSCRRALSDQRPPSDRR